MIDRLEELLAMMEDEDEEEREDVPDLTDRRVPAAAPEEDEGEVAAAGVGRGGRRDNPLAPDSGGAEDSAGEITDGGVRAPILPSAAVPGTAGRIEDVDGGISVELPKRSADGAADVDSGASAEPPGYFADETAGVDGGASMEPPRPSADETADADGAASAEEPERPAGGTADETNGEDPGPGERPEDELIWKLDIGAAQRAEAAWRRALADRSDGAAAEAVRMTAEGTMGASAERLSVEKGGELARVVRHGAESGLEGLYRQTVRASRPAPQALPVEQAGRTVRAEEPGRTAALTVDELDRVVRRDSRRYDGGMTIF